MSFSLFGPRLRLSVAAVAMGGVLVCSAQSGVRERGRPIEFSPQKSDEVATNLHQLTSKKDGLKQLEEELYQPLQSFAPKGSLDGVAARPYRPPQRSAIENKRVKELLERRKSWVFMDPDNPMGAPTLEEILKAPEFDADGKAKKDVTPMQGFFERLSKKTSRQDNPNAAGDNELFGQTPKRERPEEAAAQDEESMPTGVKDRADALKKLFQANGGDDPFAQAAMHGTFEDTFGLQLKGPSEEDLKAHKKLMADYQAEVDPGWKPLVATKAENPFASFAAPPMAASSTPAVSLPTVAVAAPRSVIDAQADIVNPRLGPTPLPDLNAQALGQPRSADAFPKIDASRVAPPKPSFEAPKRSFR